MSVPTTDVVCTVNDQDGNPVVGAKIEATLTGADIYQGYVLPRHTRAVTGAGGTVTIPLWPNQLGSTESAYAVKITSLGKTQRISAVVPSSASPVNLHEIASLPPFPGKLDGQVAIDAAQDAQAAAETARDQATSQASNAASSATAAAGSATNAATQATNASGSATAAAGSSTAAAGSATAAATSATAAAGSATAAAGSALDAAASAASMQVERLKRSVPSSFAASGTSVDLTGVPSWATKVTIELRNVGMPASASLQLKVAGASANFSLPSIEGWITNIGNNDQTGWLGEAQVSEAHGSAGVLHGRVEITKSGGSDVWELVAWTWCKAAGSIKHGVAGAAIDLTEVLTTVRVYTSNVAAFTGGFFDISWE